MQPIELDPKLAIWTLVVSDVVVGCLAQLVQVIESGMDVVGRVLLNRYQLESRLASGGMAEVYRAVDLKLGRPVAVKLLHSHLASDLAFVERLKREVQAIAALAHPGIVQVYDHGEDEGRPFLVMEMVEGESLASLLERQETLPPGRALSITRDVLVALNHVHAQGVVHRDIKPQNVLLTTNGRAKLADFGIAQGATTATLTQAGEVLGSVHYLAPERLLGQPATPAVDIYAVGVVLYQMLAGSLPFDGDDTASVAAQHLHQVPTSPSALRSSLPTWLDQIVLRALAKDPKSRYASAVALLDDLSSHRAAMHDAPTVRVPSGPSSTAMSRSEADGEVPSANRRGLLSRTVYAIALFAVLLLALLGFILLRGLWPVNEGTAAQIDAVSTLPLEEPTVLPTTVPAAQASPTAVAAVQPTPKSSDAHGKNSGPRKGPR